MKSLRSRSSRVIRTGGAFVVSGTGCLIGTTGAQGTLARKEDDDDDDVVDKTGGRRE